MSQYVRIGESIRTVVRRRWGGMRAEEHRERRDRRRCPMSEAAWVPSVSRGSSRGDRRSGPGTAAAGTARRLPRLFGRHLHRDRCPPVAARHQADLETLLELMRANVQLEGRCHIGDGDGRDRAAFSAHFQELGSSLEEWNARVDRSRTAPGSLWEWLAREARRRGITEPPYAVGTLVDRLAIIVLERALSGGLAIRRELTLQPFGEGSGGRRSLALYLTGARIARLPPDAELEPSTWLVQGLFDDAVECEEAIEIAGARDSLLDLKHQLLDRLAREAAVDPIPVAEACPVCHADSGSVSDLA